MSARWATALLLLAACAHSLAPRRPPSPPLDPRQRQAAEAEACRSGKLPAWLDDDALNTAIDLDRREGSASASNDAFRGARFEAQPPPATRPGPNATAIEDERRAFQFACDLSKRSGP